MLNCKIRFTKSWPSMGVHAGDTATFVDGILHYPGGYVGKRDYTTINNFRKTNPSAEFEAIEMEGKPVKIEDHPAFKNDAQELPRICYVLGGEKTPLKIGEKFQIKGYEDSEFWVERDGLVRFLSLDNHTVTASDSVQNAINHPENIIRRPQFSEDEKALMRLLINAGFPWIIRADRWLYACQNEPSVDVPGFKANGESEPLPPELLSRIENLTPFDAAAYLESEESI